jgi:hypothetical protein
MLSGCGGQAVAMTTSEFQKLFGDTAAGFLKLFSNLGANAGNLAGPVGVMQMGTEASKQVSTGRLCLPPCPPSRLLDVLLLARARGEMRAAWL